MFFSKDGAAIFWIRRGAVRISKSVFAVVSQDMTTEGTQYAWRILHGSHALHFIETYW